MKRSKTKLTPARNLRGKKVHLLFGLTGGGQEYLVGVFASLKAANQAASAEMTTGRMTYIDTQQIR